MTVVQKINASTPFLHGQPNSMVSKEWYRVLVSIVEVLGGASSSGGFGTISIADFQTELLTERHPFSSALEHSVELERLDILESDVRGLFAALRNNVQGRLYEAECMLLERRPVSLNNDQLVLNTGIPVDGEPLAGVINGVNAAFTLTYSPVPGSVHLFLNGVRVRLTTDYSVAGKTITYTAGAKPAAGDNHYADYRR